MRDKKLIALVVLLIALSLGHDFDHIARGTFAGSFCLSVSLLPNTHFLALGYFSP